MNDQQDFQSHVSCPSRPIDGCRSLSKQVSSHRSFTSRRLSSERNLVLNSCQLPSVYVGDWLIYTVSQCNRKISASTELMRLAYPPDSHLYAPNLVSFETSVCAVPEHSSLAVLCLEGETLSCLERKIQLQLRSVQVYLLNNKNSSLIRDVSIAR